MVELAELEKTVSNKRASKIQLIFTTALTCASVFNVSLSEKLRTLLSFSINIFTTLTGFEMHFCYKTAKGLIQFGKGPGHIWTIFGPQQS